MRRVRSTSQSIARIIRVSTALLILSLVSVAVAAQQSVPSLVQISGQFKDADGKPLTGVQGVTFALYKDQTGGATLWMETQNVTADSEGRFVALLGASSEKGLPIDLFSTGQAQWLGVQAAGYAEQPRSFLTSVPYALATPGTLSSDHKIPDSSKYAAAATGTVNAGPPSPPIFAIATDTTSGLQNTNDGAGTVTLSLIKSCSTGQLLKWNGTAWGCTKDTDVNINVTGGGLRVLANSDSPNIVAGHSNNEASGVFGATISGGGEAVNPNRVTDRGGTVGGGRKNQAGDNTTADRGYATVGGGDANTASGSISTISGGSNNSASGTGATIGGGSSNNAGGLDATVGGGAGNTASGDSSTVGGGNSNKAIGREATIPGGRFNEATGAQSFAAGNQAKAIQDGTFVWADSSGTSAFASSGSNQFLIRAAGGVGIGTNSPTEALDVNGKVKASGLTIPVGAGAGKVLTSDINGNGAWVTATGLGGTGTAPKLPRFVGPTTLGDSQISDDGNDVTVNVAGGGLKVLANAFSPNIVAGYSGNAVTVGVHAATISGGGQSSVTNRVTDVGGTVGGGIDNQAGDAAGSTGDSGNATVGGGFRNTASGPDATVGGGLVNIASGSAATVGGGGVNIASGSGATVGGGGGNTASGQDATVAGGSRNTASGQDATVPGGSRNEATGQSSLAAGNGAQAIHDGTFVWRDTSSGNGFASSGVNQFLIRAAGGVGIGTPMPSAALDVNGNVKATKFIGDGSLLTNLPGGGGGGGVSQVNTGPGLTGGPITTTGTVSIQAGGVTSAMLQNSSLSVNAGTGLLGGGPVALGSSTDLSVNTSLIQSRVIGYCLTGNAISKVNSDGSVTCEPVGIGGSGTAGKLSRFAGPAILGDSQISDNGVDVTIDVSGGGLKVLANGATPNIVAGYTSNAVTAGVNGATISGGGESSNENRVTDSGGSIGGGRKNQAGNNDATPNNTPFATVGGGDGNTASGQAATVGGGASNTASGTQATVSGGASNMASSQDATVGGGTLNTASGRWATVGGGITNMATQLYATVGGGENNIAGGQDATIPGGAFNEAAGVRSFAAGFKAKAMNTGTFVWGDSTNSDFASTGNDQFLIRAAGGVGIGTNAPSAALDINGNVKALGVIIPTGAGAGKVLTSDASGNGTWTTPSGGGGGIGGSGSTTKLPRFTGPTTLGDSQISDDGTDVTINVTGGGLKVQGSTLFPDGGANIIAGYSGNVVGSGLYGATISGGGNFVEPNTVATPWSTVAGGSANKAGDATFPVEAFSTVSGGNNNSATRMSATVSGGSSNTATNTNATVSGGTGNVASGLTSTVSGGNGNIASGQWSTVPGGYGNRATGNGSFAAGLFATAFHDNTFVWADGSGLPISTIGPNTFTARSIGGVRFISAVNPSGVPTAGVTLAPGGGGWLSMSDRNAKENLAEVDGVTLLKKLNTIPVQTWNYKTQDASTRHIGPMAQDFHAAFGLGEDEKHINTVDADGVALAGVQTLYRLLLEKDVQLEQQQKELHDLRSEMNQLQVDLKEAVQQLRSLRSEGPKP